MSAVLFWKKRVYLVITGIISTVLVCICTVYAYTLMGIQTIALNKTFYFLVTQTTHVEASTHEIELSGGAGYYLEVNKESYVTFSVYLNETDSQTVLAKVDSSDPNVRILTMCVKKIYLKTRTEKNNAEKIAGAFRSLYGCIEVLNGEIERLSKGATQESTKRILGVLEKQLKFLSVEYEEIFPQFSKVCQKSANALFLKLQSTVFVKDLRYIQCELCDKYGELARSFSL